MNPFKEDTLCYDYSSCSADTYLSWPKWNHQSWASSIKSGWFIDNMKLFHIQWSYAWLIDLIIFKELLHCNVSRCSPIEACVITTGKYQSVNNPCHLLPFYAITVFWSCGLASFTKESSIQIDYRSVCYSADQQRDSLSAWYDQPPMN